MSKRVCLFVCWAEDKLQPKPPITHLRIQLYPNIFRGLRIAYFERRSKVLAVRKVNLGKTGFWTHSNTLFIKDRR